MDVVQQFSSEIYRQTDAAQNTRLNARNADLSHNLSSLNGIEVYFPPLAFAVAAPTSNELSHHMKANCTT